MLVNIQILGQKLRLKRPSSLCFALGRRSLRAARGIAPGSGAPLVSI